MYVILLEIMVYIVFFNFGNLLVLCIVFVFLYECNNVDIFVFFFKVDCGLLFCINDGYFCKIFGVFLVDGICCGDRYVSSICGFKEFYNFSLRLKI